MRVLIEEALFALLRRQPWQIPLFVPAHDSLRGWCVAQARRAVLRRRRTSEAGAADGTAVIWRAAKRRLGGSW
jgi:hypothetical protein